jgi:hypothetical protein
VDDDLKDNKGLKKMMKNLKVKLNIELIVVSLKLKVRKKW